jgi:hypothetical protein
VTLVSATAPSFSNTTPPPSANGQSETSPENSLSADGKYLVYVSTAYNLVDGEVRATIGGVPTSTQNVYLYNTQTKTSTLISSNFNSTATSQIQGNSASFDPVISADGSTVAFFSKATDLINGDTITAGSVQLYLYNVSSGVLTLVTHTTGSSSTGGDATNPIIPTTPANAYGAVNTLGYYTGIDLGLLGGGQVVGGGIGLPSLSSDGKFVAFISNASNLGFTIPTTGAATTPSIPVTEVFLYDVANNTLTLVSHKAGDTTTGASTPKVGFASTVAISADGSTIAYTAPFNNLLSTATVDGTNDQLYVWSRINNTPITGLSAGETVLASHQAGNNNTGTTIDSTQFFFGFTGDTPPSLSSNGAFIAYYDAGSDLVVTPGGTTMGGNASVLNVFRYDVLQNTNELVTHVAGSTAVDLATAGDNPANVIAPGGVGPAEATGPVISANGRFIAFANNSSNLLSTPLTTNGGPYDGRDQVYLSDSTDHTITLVSFNNTGSTSSGIQASPTGGTAPAMSSDGRYVSYTDWAYPAATTPAPTSAEGDIRVYDSQASTQPTVPVSVGTAFDPTIPDDLVNGITGAQINAGILAPSVMSADGRVVLWDGSATTNVPNDNNGALDVFLVDRAPTPTQLVLTPTDVPFLNNSTFGQFTTIGGGPGSIFQYSFVSGSGSTNNAQFVLNSNTGQISTSSQFTLNPQGTYSIRVQTTNTNFPGTFLQTTIAPINLIQPPSSLTSSVTQLTVPNESSTQFANFTASGPTPGRMYQYSLVQGFGNNSLFTIDPNTGAISTVAGFTPPAGITQFVIAVKAQDPEFSDLFFVKQFTADLDLAPTNITSSTADVPALTNTQFAQLTTTNPTSGRTDQYSLVDTTNFPDNLLFSINPTTGELSTVASGFPVSGQTTYTIKVRSADQQFPGLFVDTVLTFTLVSAPTSIQLSNSTFAAGSGVTVGTLSVPGSNRMYQYSLATGTGSTNNGDFVISGTTLKTASGFPIATAAYSILVKVTDKAFPGLSFLQQFTVHATAPARPAPPVLTLPSLGIVGFQGTPALLNIVASPGGPNSMVSVTISGVPAGVTFSAGTNNGNGSWTFTQAQLAGLMINVSTPESFTLAVVATATFTSGTGLPSTVSGMLPVTMQIATPTITVSAPTFANPSSPVMIGVTSTSPGTEVIQLVTVNWGDGTVQTFPGAPSTYTHQYALANASYTITVSVTDQNGTFTAPPTVVATLLPTAQQAVVASLYQDLLGRNADPSGLAGWSGQLTAGVPVTQVIDGIVASTEYQTKVLNNLFLKYLGRPVDAVGIAAWLPVLQTGGPTAVAAGLINSPEFYANAGGTPQGFVQAVYLDVLGRMPDTTSATNDVLAIQFGVPLQQIALGVLDSTEAAAAAVNQVYELFLGRTADPSALAGWEQLYIHDPATFLVTFLSSPEFAERAAAGTLPVPTTTIATTGGAAGPTTPFI